MADRITRGARAWAAAVLAAAAASSALGVAALAGVVALFWPHGPCGLACLAVLVVQGVALVTLLPIGLGLLLLAVALARTARRLPGAPRWWRAAARAPVA